MIIGTMLQLAIFSQLTLLSGTADILLLILIAWTIHDRSRSSWIWAVIGGGFLSVISAIPAGVPLVVYLIVVGLVRVFSQRTLEIPILGMLIATILGTMIQKLLEMAVLVITGYPMPLGEGFVLVAMPSALLNLFFSLPVYALMTDLARWVFPIEVQL